MSALCHLVASRNNDGRFFSSIKVSGSHIDSIDLIKRGDAHVAAVDCVSFALLERHGPQSVWGLRILGRSYSAPAPPYVVRQARGEDFANRVRTALFSAYEDVSLKSSRQQLFFAGYRVYDDRPVSENPHHRGIRR